MGVFRPRDLQPSTDPAELRRQLNEIQSQLAQDLAALEVRSRISAVQTTDYNARYGELVRVSPSAADMQVTLPPALLTQAGADVTVVVEGVAGVCTIAAVDTLINGASTLVLAQRRGSVTLVLTPDGWSTRALVTSVDVLPADFDWESTLERGNSAGLFNPFVPATQFIGWGVEGSLPATGAFRSSTDWLMRSVGDIRMQSDNGLGLFAGVTAVNVLAGQIEAEASGDIWLQANNGLGLFAGVVRSNVIIGEIQFSSLLDTVFITAGVERFRLENTGAWDLAGDEGALNEVLTSQGPGVPPIWAAGGGGATPAIVSSDHILTADFTLAADEGAIIPRYHQINAGVTLTLAAGSTFSIAD